MKRNASTAQKIVNGIIILVLISSFLPTNRSQAAEGIYAPGQGLLQGENTPTATPPTETPADIPTTETPTVVESTPTVLEPPPTETPTVVEPTPVVVEPTPVVVQPTPVVVEPTPTVVVEPTPTAILVPTEETQPPQISWKVESGAAADNLGGAAAPSISGQGTLDELRWVLYDAGGPVKNLLGGPVSLIIKGKVIKGEELQLTIESNPSTGASWQISGMDATILEQAGDTYFTAGIRGRLGAAQHQVISLKAVTDGNSVVELIYRRPWETDVKPGRSVVIETSHLKDILNLTNPKTYESLQMSEAEGMVNPSLVAADQALPSSFDWRTSGKVSSVKDQGWCGSSWAFSAVGTMESALMVQGGLSEQDLSEQYLVSCNTDGMTQPTCDEGGDNSYAMDYHKVNGYKASNQTQSGAVLDSIFPYAEYYNFNSAVHACSSNYAKSYWLQQSDRDSWYVAGNWYTIPTVDQIKNAIYTYGPISASVCVGTAFQNYTSGIFTTDEGSQCTYANHAIMLVGWNDAENTWIFKNSWGTSWGESGYMRIQRGISHIGIESVYVLTSSTPQSPSGPITTGNPTFTWTKSAGATKYALYVYTTANVVKFASSAFTPTCGTTTCSYTPTLNLTVGNYKWAVRAYNTFGWSAYSTWLNFALSTPAAPTPQTPSGVGSGPNPTFTWTRPAGATQYALYVYTNATPSVEKFANYVTPTCNASTCSYTPTLNLTAGSYKWRVRAGNTFGWSAYSAWLNFARP
ncbi:MAG: protease inhibitor I42 family protein [Anaerolineales bacterium]|nr:protease inhibitor I42 family protein [Anaerolineales bacterium]